MNKEDIILVISINVGRKDIPEARAYMEKVEKEIKGFSDKFSVIFVPIRHGDHQIQCINPTFLDKKTYDATVSKILFDYQSRWDEFVAKPEPKKRILKNPPPENPNVWTPSDIPPEPPAKVEKTTKKTKKTPEPIPVAEPPVKKPRGKKA